MMYNSIVRKLLHMLCGFDYSLCSFELLGELWCAMGVVRVINLLIFWYEGL